MARGCRARASARLLAEFVGEQGQVRKMSLQFRSFMLAGDVLEIGGKVTGKSVVDGKGLVALDLWIKNGKGVNCPPGKGLVALPRRSAS